MEAQFKAIADHALLVIFAEQISEEAHARVVALDKALGVDTLIGVIETVPALVNLLVSFDPMATDHISVQRHVLSCLNGLKTAGVAGERHIVHVCYEPPFSPDLDTVATATGLSVEAVINAHLAGEFRALMYGFAPGYAYLAGVPKQIQVPRKETPVRNVPAGSVVIAGPQCLITTLTMPTGWSIIGRSPTRVFTGDPEHPFLFDVGDNVMFERVDYATFEQLREGSNNG